MQYIYIAQDLFKHPNTYMYPPFCGKNFLDSWEESRLKTLEAIAPFSSSSGIQYSKRTILRDYYECCAKKNFAEAMGLSNDKKLSAMTFEGDCTETFLHFLVEAPENIHNRENLQFLKGLIRRFEVSKKIPTFLEPPLYAIKGRPIMTCPAYAFFAQALVLLCASQPDLRWLNCLLKINDLLCSQNPAQASMAEMTPRHFDAMNIGVLGELFLLKSLLREGSLHGA